MEQYQILNELLVNLFNRITDIEQKELATGEFSDITTNDLHIIEAIGLYEQHNMGAVAKALSITMGTLTIAVNSLVKKGYVVRKRSTKDKRVVFLGLTDRGISAFYRHRQFHDNMIQGILKTVPGDQIDVLIKALSGLIAFFNHTDLPKLPT